MRLVKELKQVVEMLEGMEEIPTATAANKVIFESGSIEYNKRNCIYTYRTMQDEVYQVEAIEELKTLIEEVLEIIPF